MNRLITPRVSSQFMNLERASELYCDEVLTGDGRFIRLDISSSVSGLIRFDSGLNQAAQRIGHNLLEGVHNGS